MQLCYFDKQSLLNWWNLSNYNCGWNGLHAKWMCHERTLELMDEYRVLPKGFIYTEYGASLTSDNVHCVLRKWAEANAQRCQARRLMKYGIRSTQFDNILVGYWKTPKRNGTYNNTKNISVLTIKIPFAVKLLVIVPLIVWTKSWVAGNKHVDGNNILLELGRTDWSKKSPKK